MYSLMNSKVIVIYLLLMYCSNLKAQHELMIYTDLGKNNVSQGTFIRSAAIGYFKFGKNIFEPGLQFDLKNRNSSEFSGFTINAIRTLTIKDIPFKVQGFYTKTYCSDILGKSDYGAFMAIRHNHFEMMIGTSFSTYSLRKKGVAKYGIENKNTKIHENFNFLYSFSFYLKPSEEKWNAGLSITDIDYFIVNQETNPVLSLNGIYKFTSSLGINAQMWYKTAGTLNSHINYFGYFIRAGVIWNFK